MFLKNVAGQNLPFVLVNASTGAALTGATVTAYRCIDGGAQAAVTGTVSEKANGQYNFAPSQADMNGNAIGFLLTATGAIPVHFTIVTEDAVALKFADALLARDLGSGFGTGVLNERTVRAALRLLRNKWSIAAGTLTVTKEDDAATAWTSAVGTQAGADPIVSSDPA